MRNICQNLFLGVVVMLFITACGSSSNTNACSGGGTIEEAPIFSSAVKDMNGSSKYITLKADPDNPEDSREVKIYYSTVEAKIQEDKKEPIFYLVGGPGGSGTFAIDAILEMTDFKKLLLNRDLYIVDYRGTGFSKPFADCKLALGGTDGELEASLKACKSLMDKLNIKATDYTSKNIARDIKEIFDAENIDKAILYGTSYGTRVALTLAREYPDRVAGMVLDGTFPIEANGISQASEAVLEKLSDFESRYNNKYPNENFKTKINDDLFNLDRKEYLYIINNAFNIFPYIPYNYEDEKSFNNLLNFLENNASREELYSFILTDILSNIAYTDIGLEFIHEMDNLKENNFTTSKIKYSRKIDFKYNHLQEGVPMAFSIILYEEYAFIAEQPAYEFGFDAEKNILNALKGFLGGSPVPIDRFSLMSKYFKVSAPDPIEMEPVATDVPTILFAGGRDVQTALYWAINTKSYLSNSRLFFYPMEGHVFSFINGDSFKIVREFLDNPNDLSDNLTHLE